MNHLTFIRKGLFILLPLLGLQFFAGAANKDSLYYKGRHSGHPITAQNAAISFTEDFFEKYNFPNAFVDENKQKAKAALTEVEASNNFVEYLKPSDISKLPVGFSKKVGGSKITLAITKAVFTPRYAELTIFAKVTIPQQPGTLFFGVQGLKLSNNGGIIGDAKLVLLGDVAIPINGRNNALVLKGGYDGLTGDFTSKTYITIDCNGFKELGLAADISFPRGILLPVDETTGEVLPTGNVKGSFETVVADWNDIIASFSLPKFQINGLKDFNFKVTDAVFDFSDYRNTADVNYPVGYQQKYVSTTDPESWRGIYVKNLDLDLPKAFAKRTNNNRVSIGVNDLIIDNNGLTGLFYAENILPISQGSASGWKFSVDSLRLAIEANRITRAGFGGKIGVPTAKNTLLAYGAVITASSDYIITVTNKDTLSFDLWAAKAYIDPNSYIKLSSINGKFRPEAMLHGRMGVYITKQSSTESTNANSKNITEFNGIKFTSMLIKTESPKFSVQYFGYEGELKLANFPISVENISISTPTANELSLNFTAKLNLHQGKITGSTTLSIISEWEQDQGLESLSYKRIDIGAVSVHADLGGLKVDGNIQFLRNDAVYGDGFRGNISAEFLGKAAFKIDVTAIFGSTSFRYWFFDGLVSGLNIPIFPPVNLTGFGGGAYYRMKKLPTATATRGTGYDYVPDSTAGLGIRAAVLFNAVKSNVADGQASFEIAFNSNGGLRYVGFFGYAKIAAKIGEIADANSFLTSKFGAIDAKLNEALGPLGDTASIIRKKMFQPTQAAKDLYPTSNIPGSVGLEAFLGIQYNFDTKTLDANFDLYVNAAKGLIKGTASGNRAGWARFYVSPSKWYLHMGKPDDRIGLKVGIAGISVQTSGYFMIGHDIPNMPTPPAEVQSIIGGYNADANNVKNKQNELELGTGFAFGTSVNITTGDIQVAIFYARVDAGAGFDIFVKDRSNYHCVGDSDPIGMNGWYLDGQAYAYFQGDVGIRIKIFGFRKNVSILKLAVAALVEAHMPNPTWFKGTIAGSYSVFGGAIRGHCNFSFKIGSPCQIEMINPSDEYLGLETIDNISITDNAEKVSTLAVPSVTFKMKVGQAMEADIDGQEQYRVMVDKMEVVKVSNNSTINGTWRLQYDSLGAYLPLADRLEALTNYKFKVSVYFQEFRNNIWTTIYKDGNRLIDAKEVLFKTGEQPDTIERSNIAYSWPAISQKNFYKVETGTGYIKLKNPQPYLFTTFNNYYAAFKDQYDNELYTPITFDNGNNIIEYQIPQALINGRSYTFSIKGRNVEFEEEDANLNYEYINVRGENVNLPEVIDILEVKEIEIRIEDEITSFLRAGGLSYPAVRYFFSLDEIRRVAFLTAAHFNSDNISYYINIREQVIRQMLQDKGYGSAQIETFMDEMQNAIQKRKTVAQMRISEETQKPLTRFNFRVSDYNTFGSKMNSLQTVQSIIGRVSTDVINLQAKVSSYEGFDAYELQQIPDNYGNLSVAQGLDHPVISGQASMDDIYYLAYIKNLIYKDAFAVIILSRGPASNTTNTVLISSAGVEFGISSRNPQTFGLIPTKALSLSSYYYNDAISGNSNFVNQRFPFMYSLPEIYNGDFLDLRRKVINYYINLGQSIPAEFNALVNDPFPFINAGEYRAHFQYHLPNGNAGSGGTFTYINQIQ